MRRTVLIVDDHPDYRSSARRMLESEGFAIVGEAGDGHAALAEAVRLQPGIVLLDIQLPDIDGFAVAECLADTPDPPAIVLISTRPAEAYGDRVAAAPVRGFLAKGDLTAGALRELTD